MNAKRLRIQAAAEPRDSQPTGLRAAPKEKPCVGGMQDIEEVERPGSRGKMQNISHCIAGKNGVQFSAGF
jgi:hypothetical protein